MPSSSSAMPALPPGFHFHPTDEELIVHYLMNQVSSIACPVPIIAEVNIYKYNPWDLPAKALFGEEEWYFFSPRDRKYPNGARPNRAAGSGYWKATGSHKAILSTPTSDHIGVKKALVFYRGKLPRGIKTDWIMHEYLLTGTSTNKNRTTKKQGACCSSQYMRLDDWVLCRIHKKNNDFSDQQEQKPESSTADQLEENSSSEPPAPADMKDEHSALIQPMTMSMSKSCSLTDLLNTIDCAALSQFLLDGSSDVTEPTAPPSPLIYPDPCQTLNYNVNNNNMPHAFEARQDHHRDDHINNYNGLRRKRMMACSSGATSFDDGKCDLRGSALGRAYCNQPLSETTTGFQFQNSNLLSHPFPLNQ